MNRFFFFLLGRFSLALILFSAGLSPCRAQIITLTDNNSLVYIDTASSAGMFFWGIGTVNSTMMNSLKQQAFWFRVGSSAPERPISSISAPIFTVPDARSLYTAYNNGFFGVTVSYLLTGGMPIGPDVIARSDMIQTISVTNAGPTALDFHLFQYSNFDLLGPGNQTVRFGRDVRGLFNEVVQESSFAALTETVVSPGANHSEGNYFNATLTKLTDANPDVLNDDSGPVGPGDVTWALQWDFLVQPESSVGISTATSLRMVGIPEPSMAALISLGALIGVIHRRRRYR